MLTIVTAYIGLGANLGNAHAALDDAVQKIAQLAGTHVTDESSRYRTAPIDSSGPDYINAVLEIRTALLAHDLLSALQAIEAQAGRERPYRNAPRTLDLDILLYGNESIATESLTVPHPRMWERAFVLVPLAEIAPDLVTAQALQAVLGQGVARISSKR